MSTKTLVYSIWEKVTYADEKFADLNKADFVAIPSSRTLEECWQDIKTTVNATTFDADPYISESFRTYKNQNNMVVQHYKHGKLYKTHVFSPFQVERA